LSPTGADAVTRFHDTTTTKTKKKKICRIFKEIKKIEQTDVTALLKKKQGKQ
jgi:hypothetical protein